MTRVLIIKTSSMGDIVHNLPVVADIRHALPEAVIDWVVEEAYVELVAMSDAVARVIPIATRRWRQEAPSRSRAERRAFDTALRRDRYDVVLDTQGLLKSALVARRARLAPGGARVGFALGVVREALARVFYDRAYAVDRRLHAIERMRALSAAAFGYAFEAGVPPFGLTVPARRFAWLAAPIDVRDGAAIGPAGDAAPRRYAVLLHATARAEKAWPPERWEALIDLLCDAGITPVLPSGNPAERQAAEALAAHRAAPGKEAQKEAQNEGQTEAQRDAGSEPIVAPPLTLPDAAALLAGATVVVGVDTGLLHLAAALDVPTVGLFGATPRWRYAPYWSPVAISLGSFGELGAQPGVAAVVEALARLGLAAAPGGPGVDPIAGVDVADPNVGGPAAGDPDVVADGIRPGAGR